MKEPKPMQEVHEWRHKIYEENKNLTWKQRVQKAKRITEKMIRRYRLKIKIHRPDKAA